MGLRYPRDIVGDQGIASGSGRGNLPVKTTPVACDPDTLMAPVEWGRGGGLGFVCARLTPPGEVFIHALLGYLSDRSCQVSPLSIPLRSCQSSVVTSHVTEKGVNPPLSAQRVNFKTYSFRQWRAYTNTSVSTPESSILFGQFGCRINGGGSSVSPPPPSCCRRPLPTTAVGVNILPRIAPALAKGIQRRHTGRPRSLRP